MNSHPDPDLLWHFTATFMVVFGMAGIRAIGRRRRGEFVFRPTLPNVKFEETWISGGAGWFGSARNCLWVTLTDDHLWVNLHFPFCLFIPRLLGLEAKVAPNNVIGIENKESFLGGRHTVIHFRDDNGRARAIDLTIHDADDFVRDLKEVCAAHGRVIT